MRKQQQSADTADCVPLQPRFLLPMCCLLQMRPLLVLLLPLPLLLLLYLCLT